MRPGESLWSIAERYLGAEKRWPELHALNSDIVDPHRIAPGQRVRVRVVGEHAIDLAKVVTISRKVEELLTPHPWLPSAEDDLLNPRDGMRTFENASTELLFADDTRLVISEDSLVFLGHAGRVERKVRRDEIEIVVGQADIEGGANANERQLVAGGSRLKPRVDATGRSQARFRRPEAGGAQVMIYAGDSVVESGGVAQPVAAGMGTQMQDGEQPGEPEELLPAAQPRGPAAGSEWSIGEPPFSWSTVEAAASYIVEVCLDVRCGALIERRTELAQTTARLAPLAPGSYYWRVTAVSASGLDGYSSTPALFTILAAGSDDQPPKISVAFTGTQIERDGVLYLGADATLDVDVTDAGSGVEKAWAELDGSRVELPAIESGWAVGAHQLVIHASDRSGNSNQSAAVRFVFDPDPPEIHWGTEGGGLYHSFQGEYAVPSVPEAGRRRQLPELDWSRTRDRWQSLGSAQWTVERRVAPRFFLRSGRGRHRVFALPGVSLPVGRGAGIGVLANDALVGTRQLLFRLEEQAAGGTVLRVEAVDWLSNRSTVWWPVVRGRGARR